MNLAQLLESKIGSPLTLLKDAEAFVAGSPVSIPLTIPAGEKYDLEIAPDFIVEASISGTIDITVQKK